MVSLSRCNRLALHLSTTCLYLVVRITARNHTTWFYPPPGSSLTINYGDTVIPSWNSSYEDLYTGTTTLEPQLYVFCGDDTYYGPDAVGTNDSHPWPFVDMTFIPDLDPLPTNCSFGLGYQALDGIVNQQSANLSTQFTLTNKTKEEAQTWSSGSPTTRTAAISSATSSQTATASGASQSGTAATALATPTQSPSSSFSGPPGISTGAKAGIAVAVVVVSIPLLIALIVWLRRKRQRKSLAAEELDSSEEQQQQKGPGELADERRDVSELPHDEQKHEMGIAERYEMPAVEKPVEMSTGRRESRRSDA